MTDVDLLRAAAAAVLALLIWWSVASTGRSSLRPNGRYGPVYGILVLPVGMIAVLCFSALLGWDLLDDVASGFGSFLLHVGLYELVLLLFLPLLRRYFSAAACAGLYLLPNAAFYLCAAPALLPDHPLYVLRLSRQTGRLLLWVWLAGFVGVLAWHVVRHLHYRRQLLYRAEPAPKALQRLLYDVQRELDCSPRGTLVVSPAAQTPLSIGLSERTVRIVLPRREYDEKALRLIFRHEMIHLLHGDNQAKLLLCFVNAAGWFLPWTWLGIRRSSEDLELCCDELVTAELDEAGRRRYGELLLQNAGPAPGFTTCLSATAKGLRYRLGRILHHGERLVGGVLAGLLVFALVLSFGYTGFALRAGTLEEEVFDRLGGGCEIVSLCLPGKSAERECTDPERLLQALGALELYELSAGYRCETALDDGAAAVHLRCGGQEVHLYLQGDYLAVGSPLFYPGHYVLKAPLDPELLKQCAGKGIQTKNEE